MDATITLTVNGTKRTLTTDRERSLLDVLREDLQLTGAKYGCGEGRCGACTVLVDGKNVHSCRLPAADVDQKSVTTIEGLANGDKLHPVQEAFLAEGAMQCGYCTPGMVLTAVALLEKHPRPTDEQVRQWMNGNLCRCNGYTKILRAIHRAAGKTGPGPEPAPPSPAKAVSSEAPVPVSSAEANR
jgi:aerobic-type carbon monoxide dehydrogenase small subunit (CoxS/CutS family)